MNKILLAIGVLITSLSIVRGQYQDTANWKLSDDRQKIQVAELPEPVKIALESTDYTGWTIHAVYRSQQISTADENVRLTIYIVELKSGPDLRTDKFDRDGNRIDEKLALRE